MAGTLFTRFDFNVVAFLNSYDVEMMSDAEVGQYILLLAKAWLMQKGAALPDDPAFLSRVGHCTQVTERVLSKFPITETENGPMRRNKTLYEEWVAAVDRSEAGRAKGQVTTEAKAEAARQNGALGGRPKALILTGNPTGKPTEPNGVSQPRSDQSVSEAGSGAATGPGTDTGPKLIGSSHAPVLLATSGAAAPDPARATPAPDFMSFRREWHSLVKAAGRLSKGRHFVDKYMAVCQIYGADKVSAAFQSWAKAKPDWKWAHDHGHAFNAFVKQLPDVIEEVDDNEILPTPVAAVVDEEIPAATPAELAGADAAAAAYIALEKQQREERIRKFGGGPAMEQGSALDYIAEAASGK